MSTAKARFRFSRAPEIPWGAMTHARDHRTGLRLKPFTEKPAEAGSSFPHPDTRPEGPVYYVSRQPAEAGSDNGRMSRPSDCCQPDRERELASEAWF